MLMKILNILIDGPDVSAELIIAEHKKQHDVEIIDLSQNGIQYDEVVDKIDQFDKVISW